MLIKHGSLTLLRNLAIATFDEYLIEFQPNVNLFFLLYLMVLRCCLLYLIWKRYFLLKSFPRMLILMTQVFLYLEVSRSNLKMHNVSVSFNTVKKGITDLDSSKAWLLSWLNYNGDFEEVWAWGFMYISWCFQYVLEGILFFDIVWKSNLLLLYFQMLWQEFCN